MRTHDTFFNLFQVLATDRDIDRHNNITYSLQGHGTERPNKYFQINALTGDIFLIRPLDRDSPHGRANYQFTVVAKDEPTQPWQSGYATVEVLPEDINDNFPKFITSTLHGVVDEHSPPGTATVLFPRIFVNSHFDRRLPPCAHSFMDTSKYAHVHTSTPNVYARYV